MNSSTAVLRTESKKRYIRNIGLIFLLVIILLTFFSKTINEFLMPEVEYRNPQAGYLQTEIKTNGEVKAVSVEKIYAYGSWNILDVKVREGMEVVKGDVLAVVDTGDVMLDMKTIELEVIKMENALQQYRESFDSGLNKDDVYQLSQAVEKAQNELDTARTLYESGAESQRAVEEAENRLEDAEHDYSAKLKELDKRKIDYERTLKEKEAEFQLKKLKYKKLMEKIPENGNITSPVDGIIKTSTVEKGMVSNNGQILFEIIKKDSKLAIEWKLNPIKAEALKVGDEAAIKIKSGDNSSIEGKIKEKQFLAKDGMYLFTSEINADENNVRDGQEVEVSVTRRSTDYPIILPNSSISKQGGKDCVFVLKERDGVMGKENYVVTVNVKVEESDDFNSAISGTIRPEDDIVVFSTKALTDGMQVKLN